MNQYHPSTKLYHRVLNLAVIKISLVNTHLLNCLVNSFMLKITVILIELMTWVVISTESNTINHDSWIDHPISGNIQRHNILLLAIWRCPIMRLNFDNQRDLHHRKFPMSYLSKIKFYDNWNWRSLQILPTKILIWKQ